MNAQKHTPEPWQVFSIGTTTLISQQIDSEGRFAHASVLFPTFHQCGLAAAREEQEANAARIVACVNACEGIETDALTEEVQRVGGFAAVLSVLENVKTERDALRAEVERLAGQEKYLMRERDEWNDQCIAARRERDACADGMRALANDLIKARAALGAAE